MDIRDHPTVLTEPIDSLEAGSKIKTELTNDFLAHEREPVNNSESHISTLNSDAVNNVDKILRQEIDNSKISSVDDNEILENGNSENTNRIEEIIKTGNEEPINKLKEGREDVSGGKRDGEQEDEEKEIDEVEDEWLDILGSGQLKKKVLRKTQNSYRPQRSYIVEINVEGQLPDGTIIDHEKNLILQIGDAEHIQAIDLVLPMMDVGEIALLDVAPRFAYGSLGREPDVPPNTNIMYTVELLSAEMEPEVETLPAEKRKNIGCGKRERGNFWYARQEYSLAIQCYRRALDFLDDVEGGVSLPTSDSSENKEDDSMLKDLLEERLKVYNNLAAAQMKIKAFETALSSVEIVLRCQPDNVKALYRKGKILSEKGEHSKAVEVLRQASRLEPDNRMIRQELLQMLSLHREDTKNEKNLYKKMLGQDKPPEEIPFNENTGLFKSIMSAQFQFPWSVVFGTLAALVAGVVAYRYKFM